MTNLVLTLGALALIAILGWSFKSRRHSIPCPSWLGWLVELDNPLFRNNRAAAIVAGLGLRPGMAVLDAGCGPGRLTIPMAREVGPAGRVTALDLQAGMLRKAAEKAKSAGLSNIAFKQADIAGGVSGEAAFDRATLVTVLGEVPDKRAALEAIFAALKPGGILAITEVVADPHFQPRASVVRLAESVGFRERSRSGGSLSYTLYCEKPFPRR
jgi:2-polyprenyl-3-methyl-5-hydroxy-6-metoxy-1,4-benzoquinol methylase